MSKLALFAVGAVVVVVFLYRRGLARKKALQEAEFEDELQALNAAPRRGPAFDSSSATVSVSEVLTAGTMRDAISGVARVSTSITREAFDALPVAKVVNIETGQEVGWGPRAPARVQPSREEVAAMMPVVYSSPTAVRGNYRTAL